MSNRANLVITDGDESVNFYTHWGHDKLPAQVRAALTRGRERWDDFPYLARIIFCEMVKHDVLGKLGYGISQHPEDPDPDFLISVNTDSQTVTIGDNPPISFADFVNSTVGW